LPQGPDNHGRLCPDRLDEVADASDAKREPMFARRATLAGTLHGPVERRREDAEQDQDLL